MAVCEINRSTPDRRSTSGASTLTGRSPSAKGCASSNRACPLDRPRRAAAAGSGESISCRRRHRRRQTLKSRGKAGVRGMPCTSALAAITRPEHVKCCNRLTSRSRTWCCPLLAPTPSSTTTRSSSGWRSSPSARTHPICVFLRRSVVPRDPAHRRQSAHARHFLRLRTRASRGRAHQAAPRLRRRDDREGRDHRGALFVGRSARAVERRCSSSSSSPRRRNLRQTRADRSLRLQ